MSPASSLRQYSYYGGWFLRSKFGIKRPLVNTMIIHYQCNLRCQHCSIVANADKLPDPRSMSFEAASREMRTEFEKGARILFFEGGEPTIWKDGEKGLGDLIAEGRRIGYYVIGYTTNGIGQIFEESDVVSISLDGPREVHDRIRGAGNIRPADGRIWRGRLIPTSLPTWWSCGRTWTGSGRPPRSLRETAIYAGSC